MCVCARRQPSPTAASPGSPWSPVRVPLCSAASSTCPPPNIVHTALAAALAIPPAAAPACLIAFATHAPRVSCSSDRPLFCPRPPSCASCSFPPPLAPVPAPNPSVSPAVPSRCLFRLRCPSLSALASACALRISYSSWRILLPGAGIGRSHSRWPVPGLRDSPPSPRPTVSSSGLPAECARVVGGGLGWWEGGQPRRAPPLLGSTPG